MPVYKDTKRNSWYVKFSYKDSQDKWKTFTKRGFASSKEAKTWERSNRNDPYEKADEAPTFNDIFGWYLASLQASKTSSSRYTCDIDKRFSELKNKPIDQITKKDLIEWRAKLISTGYSTITCNGCITLVRSVFKFANDIYDYPNPSGCLKRLKKTDDELLTEMHIWTPEQFNQFLAHVQDYTYKVFFEFLFWTGCRKGEAIAIQKNALSDRKAMIRYSQRYNKDGLKPTKTRQLRTIELDERLWDDIQPLLSGSGTYVFGGKEGLPPTTIERIFKRATNEAGLPQIRIHDLRHSHASWLINNGVNIVAVSKRLGHATIEQTLKTYTHLMEQSDQEMMSKINTFRDPKNDPKFIQNSIFNTI